MSSTDSSGQLAYEATLLLGEKGGFDELVTSLKPKKASKKRPKPDDVEDGKQEDATDVVPAPKRRSSTRTK